jgi:hypothetical protein
MSHSAKISRVSNPGKTFLDAPFFMWIGFSKLFGGTIDK